MSQSPNYIVRMYSPKEEHPLTKKDVHMTNNSNLFRTCDKCQQVSGVLSKITGVVTFHCGCSWR